MDIFCMKISQCPFCDERYLLNNRGGLGMWLSSTTHTKGIEEEIRKI